MENKVPNYRIEQEIEGLPQHYPTLNHNDDFVFYIQRNINQNTVIYSINYNAFGDINLNSPLRMYWKKFEEDGQTQELNALQEYIAYGYKSQMINFMHNTKKQHYTFFESFLCLLYYILGESIETTLKQFVLSNSKL